MPPQRRSGGTLRAPSSIGHTCLIRSIASSGKKMQSGPVYFAVTTLHTAPEGDWHTVPGGGGLPDWCRWRSFSSRCVCRRERYGEQYVGTDGVSECNDAGLGLNENHKNNDAPANRTSRRHWCNRTNGNLCHYVLVSRIYTVLTTCYFNLSRQDQRQTKTKTIECKPWLRPFFRSRKHF